MPQAPHRHEIEEGGALPVLIRSRGRGPTWNQANNAGCHLDGSYFSTLQPQTSQGSTVSIPSGSEYAHPHVGSLGLDWDNAPHTQTGKKPSAVILWHLPGSQPGYCYGVNRSMTIGKHVCTRRKTPREAVSACLRHCTPDAPELCLSPCRPEESPRPAVHGPGQYRSLP